MQRLVRQAGPRLKDRTTIERNRKFKEPEIGTVVVYIARCSFRFREGKRLIGFFTCVIARSLKNNGAIAKLPDPYLFL